MQYLVYINLILNDITRGKCELPAHESLADQIGTGCEPNLLCVYNFECIFCVYNFECIALIMHYEIIELRLNMTSSGYERAMPKVPTYFGNSRNTNSCGLHLNLSLNMASSGCECKLSTECIVPHEWRLTVIVFWYKRKLTTQLSILYLTTQIKCSSSIVTADYPCAGMTVLHMENFYIAMFDHPTLSDRFNTLLHNKDLSPPVVLFTRYYCLALNHYTNTRPQVANLCCFPRYGKTN